MRPFSSIAALSVLAASALLAAGCGWSPKGPDSAPQADKCTPADGPAQNVVTASIYALPAPPSGKWTQMSSGHTANCALYWVQVGQNNSTPDSPQQVVFFNKNTMIGTPTPNARPYITVTASAPDSVTVQYQWEQAKDQPGMPTGIGSTRFTVDGGALKALDPIPGPK
ncbi:LppP/LprE family lipoprotein [Mycolicibacterium llatzerense]|uniref:Lipoprotein LppP n=1 Tax=Mycolicibacterium llatzerense TaxID=280871 RepID=A0A0D1JXX1_9MYCO|nr:LppP/LprE family lipoprotein [Mycolicibacterium llatzerense]KIU17489.1 lipoprotein LppP [Mycolicibacterium llatzerense]